MSSEPVAAEEVLRLFVGELQQIKLSDAQAEAMVRERRSYWRMMDDRRATLSGADQPANFPVVLRSARSKAGGTKL
jgi:hypothetical protein